MIKIDPAKKKDKKTKHGELVDKKIATDETLSVLIEVLADEIGKTKADIVSAMKLKR